MCPYLHIWIICTHHSHEEKIRSGYKTREDNQDIWVANEIFLDNIHGHTGYNTKIQRI